MATRVKDVIKPGVYRVGETEISVSEADIQRWVENFNAMKSSGLAVSVPWEHPRKTEDEAYPLLESDPRRKEREQSRLNAGWVNRLFVEDGVLKSEVEIPRDDDLKQIDEVGTYVSPQFGPWTDPTGKRWDSAITHLALTNKPVNTDQTRQFAKTGRVEAGSVTEPVRFSLADLQTQFGGADETEESTETETETAEEESPAKIAEPATDEKKVGQLRTSLASHGIILPEGWKPSDLDTLIAAVASAEATRKLNEKKDPEPGDVTEEAATVSMSQTANTTDKKTEPSPETVQLSRQVEGLNSEITNLHREKYTGRINGLFQSGRCDKPTADKLTELAGTYQFSQGAPKGELDIRLETLEALPAGAVWSDDERVQQFSIQEHRPNSAFFEGGEVSDERADEIVDELHGSAPRK